MTKTKTRNLDRWIDQHRITTMDERFGLAEAIKADRLTAAEAVDYLIEREVDISPRAVQEALVVAKALTRASFQQHKARFNSWKALYQWAQEGAPVAMLTKLPTPITEDAVRRHFNKVTSRFTQSEQARKMPTSELLGELNARMDDENVVDEVIDAAVKASSRNAKRRAAQTGKSPSGTKVPRVGSAGLEVMSDLKDLSQRMRRTETKAAVLDGDSLAAVVNTFESDVAPAYGSLSLTILGARV